MADRQPLRRKVAPLMQRHRETGDETEVRVAVRRVMGHRWRPTGRWAEPIRRLGGVP